MGADSVSTRPDDDPRDGKLIRPPTTSWLTVAQHPELRYLSAGRSGEWNSWRFDERLSPSPNQDPHQASLADPPGMRAWTAPSNLQIIGDLVKKPADRPTTHHRLCPGSNAAPGASAASHGTPALVKTLHHQQLPSVARHGIHPVIQ